jgi:hypothetical protein
MVEAKRRSRRIFIGLGMLFLAPILLAFTVYYGVDGHWLKKTNKGVLMTSPIAVTKLHLVDSSAKGFQQPQKWLLLYRNANCDQSCMKVLSKMLRVRMTLGRDMYRTQSILISSEKLTAEISNQLADVKGLDTKILLISKKDKQLQGPAIYVADPLGNVILRYKADVQPKDLKSDLIRLLKVSNIG